MGGEGVRLNIDGSVYILMMINIKHLPQYKLSQTKSQGGEAGPNIRVVLVGV